MHNSKINWAIVAVLYRYYRLNGVQGYRWSTGVKLYILEYICWKKAVHPFSSRGFIVLAVRFMHTVAHVTSSF